jgi:O-antigen/teichoic acid export membrane protein
MMLGFISFPIFTRLFSVEQYGQINLVLTAVVFGTVFAKLGLQNSANRYYSEHVDRGDAGSAVQFQSTLYLGSVLTGLGATLLFVLVITVTPGGLISPALKPLLGLSSSLILIRGIQSIALSLFQAGRRTAVYNIVDLATKLATVPTILLLAFFWRTDVRAYLWGTVTGEGLVLIVATLLLRRGRKIEIGRLSWGFLGELLSFGAPLAISEMAKIGLDLGHRFLVQFYLGSKAVGYYAAAYNMSSYLQASVVAPLGLALQPIYMHLWNTRGEAATADFVTKALKYYVFLCGCIISLVTACSSDVLTLLASSKYREANRLLPLVIAGLMVYGIHLFLNAGLFIHRRSGTLAVVVVFSCVFSIALNCILIPRLGLQGAAIASLVSYAVFVIIMAAVSNRYLVLRLPYAAAMKAVAGGVLVVALVRLNLGGPFLNCLARGTAGLLVYGLVICGLEKELRQALFETIGRAWNGCGPDSTAVLMAGKKDRRID